MLYIVGIILIGFGCAVLIDPVFYSHKYSTTIDLSGVRWIVGPLSVIWGIYSFYSEAKRVRSGYSTEYWICPKCEKTIMLTNNGEMKCKKCDVVLEKLVGFYKEHPDKKGEEVDSV